MATLQLSESDLNSSVGVLFLGAVFSSMIYGLTCLQTFSYFRSPRSQKDHKWTRIMVIVLLALDSLHQALVLHLVYVYVVLGYGNPIVLFTTLLWSGPAEILINGLLGLMFNTFLAYRLWRLSANTYLVVLAMLLSFASFGTILSFGIRAFSYSNLTDASIGLKHHGLVVLALFFASDSFASASLCYYLFISRTGVRRSNDIITKLITLTVTTGALCALCNLVDLFVYIAAPDKLYDLFFTFIMSKRELLPIHDDVHHRVDRSSFTTVVYANALLTTLNMRRYIREIAERNPSNFDGINLSETTRSIHTSPQQLQIPRDPTHAFTVNVNIDGAKSRSLVLTS
ncbi:hypothetical protein C8Q76DRAFT_791366 [Earliella scabrosa]|nr:hypothetical protein C8Q76DRAFT_791366 [Earliella scabrosa]